MNFTQKKNNKFICETCDYSTCNKYDYNIHIATVKHVNRTNQEEFKNTQPYTCKNCRKVYKARSSLWYHEKKCVIEQETATKNENTNKSPIISQEMVMEILKQNDDLKNLLMEQNKQMMEQNHEFKGMMIDICKNGINHVNNSNNTNSHNKTFNLQFFLNEQCKDAMNMVDFANSLQLTLQDAENVGKLGYVRGMSNIIIDNLKALDIYKRPIHCTDTKRDVMYVKDDNKWEKETEEFKTIRRLIKSVTIINGKNIRLFKTKHPCCGTSESIYSDQYSKMYIEGFGGSGTDRDNENKIIKRMAREITIDR